MELHAAASLSRHAYVDYLRIESCGLLTVAGWASPAERDHLRALAIRVDGNVLSPRLSYGHHRADLKSLSSDADAFWGFCVEFQLEPGTYQNIELLRNADSTGKPLFAVSGLRLSCGHADYSMFRTSEDVFHRENVYGSGMPAEIVNRELRLLAESLPGKILDFGCGRGVLVGLLRAQGKDAEGLELDHPKINGTLPDELRPHVRLYDGSFPVPYGDDAFDWVIASEVMEHIPDYRTAISEAARISHQGLLLTVPDMSAVPTLHKHNVVPWHLLESTHFNFFTQQSLDQALREHFREVNILRIGASQINGSHYWISLVAIARH